MTNSVRANFRKSSQFQPMAELVGRVLLVERPALTRSLCAVAAIQRMLKVELGSDYCGHKYSGLYLATVLRDAHGLQPVGYFRLDGYGRTLVMSENPDQFIKTDIPEHSVRTHYTRQRLTLNP